VNGVHDMGGMHGFGAVAPERDEPVFHAPWEGRVLAMNRAMGSLGLWNIDIGRFSRESLPPDVYLSSSYYRRWTLGLEDLVVRYGLVGADELAAGRALHPAAPGTRKLAAADAPKLLARGSYERPAASPARFRTGDRVRTKNMHPAGHTRLPRYVRGHAGVVECVRGCQVFPDAVAAGRGEEAQWLYTVVFDGRELWGEAGDPTLEVSVEAWEPYLEPA
jgi:nitrile hydratase subunit beta